MLSIPRGGIEPAVLLAAALPLLGLAAAGCRTPSPSPLGLMQLGEADRFCSAATGLLVGPITARARNEGFVKTSSEIDCLTPFWEIPSNWRHAALAHAGLTREQLQQGLRRPINVACYADTLETVDICERRGIVSTVSSVSA
jgi:hypothetical protein